jgi:glucoamylase
MHPRTWLARAGAGATAAALCAGTVTACATSPPRLLISGIVADRAAPDGIRTLPAGPAAAGSPETTVPAPPAGGTPPGSTPPGSAPAGGTPAGGTPAGSGLAGSTPAGGAEPGAADRRWLAAGTVPGSTPAQRRLARGALIDLRLLTRPGGAMAAAWFGRWKYSWPRDSSWAAAAFAATGHFAESLSILRFLARVQYPSGTWAAKYTLAGAPVRTPQTSELDADGWFPWAVWVWYAEHERGSAGPARRQLSALWPAVRRAADVTVARLSPGGLPPPSPDYWEQRVNQPTIGTAAPLLAGLRSAGRLAASRGDVSDARRWDSAAARLDRAVQAAFQPNFYRFPSATGGERTWFALFGTGADAGQAGLPADSILNGPDAAVTFLGPPFRPASAIVRGAVARAARALTLPNGGILPGTTWRVDRTAAWTPATGFFALYDAASGHAAAATAWLDWLAAHRTAAGALPEQVGGSRQPVSVAPLGWTCAIVLLALTALRHPLPVP